MSWFCLKSSLPQSTALSTPFGSNPETLRKSLDRAISCPHSATEYIASVRELRSYNPGLISIEAIRGCAKVLQRVSRLETFIIERKRKVHFSGYSKLKRIADKKTHRAAYKELNRLRALKKLEKETKKLKKELSLLKTQYNRIERGLTSKKSIEKLAKRGKKSKVDFYAPKMMQFFQKNGFKLKDELGSGGFGRVFRASIHPEIALMHSIPGEVAIKIANIDGHNTSISDVKGEALGLLIDNNSALMTIYGIITRNSQGEFKLILKNDQTSFSQATRDKEEIVGIVSEYLPLSRPLNSELNSLNLEQKRVVSFEVAHGISQLHSQKVMHRDIKPENVLIKIGPKKQVEKVKLIDFGLSKSLKTGPINSTGTGTHGYQAPEVLSKDTNPYSKECDIWSYGSLLIKLYFDSPPFKSHSNMKDSSRCEAKMVEDHLDYADKYADTINESAVVAFRILFGGRVNLNHPLAKNENFCDLILQTLNPDPENRIPLEGILSHPFFDDSVDSSTTSQYLMGHETGLSF